MRRLRNKAQGEAWELKYQEFHHRGGVRRGSFNENHRLLYTSVTFFICQNYETSQHSTIHRVTLLWQNNMTKNPLGSF